MGRIRVSDRMNRLPVTGYTKLVCACMFIGWMCEAIDLGITGYMLPTISEYWGMSTMVAGWYSSACFVGMFIGSLVGGPIADWKGRKPIIVIFMIVSGCASLGMALAPTIEILFALRFVLGIGLGVQFPVAVAYISENLPSRKRGKYVALYQLFLPIGMALAALLALGLLEPLGWRGIYALTAVPGLWCIAVLKICPESAIWLEAKGRTEEADRVMEEVWEKKAAAYLAAKGEYLAPVVPTQVEAAPAGRAKLSDLFHGKQGVLTFLAFAFMFCSMQSDYGLTTWLSTLFVAKGFAITKAIGFIFIGILGGIPGYFLSAWGVEKFGRKQASFIACLATGVFGILYGFSNSEIMIIVMGFFYNMGKYAVAMCFLVYLPELFETQNRAAGNGLGSAGGRLGAILGAPLMAWIFSSFGPTSTFVYAAVLVLVGGVLALALGPETRDKSY